MDLVTGALGLLPSKLLELLKDEYKLQKSIREKIQSVSWELESMHAALHKVAAVPWDQLDEQVKVWAREVREASYDMEDILDTFIVRVDGHEPAADLSRLKRAMKKMGDLFSKGKARRDISCAIEDIRKQLQEVAERRARYRVDDLVAAPDASTSIDPRLSALYTKVSQLIGIQEPRDEVISLLTAGEQMEMKLVTIVGGGGLGKTTLAKAVYENLTQNVRFKAFVPVGQNPDLKKVLKDILIGLGRQRYAMEFNLTVLDERQLIDELREFLKNKRYFIVIDDIWDVPSWNMIRHALDDNSLGSKIVITTRKHDVAREVGCSYNMEPLPYESSKVLFYGRIFGFEQKCPNQFVEVSEKIIKKCGGVPLAIITTSSLLANKSGNKEEWYDLCESIGTGLGNNHGMENMRKILSLSYYDLPAHLKTCLLYISLFPEDSKIDRDRLIWRWIAEDFVSHGEVGKSLFDIGKGYFSELLNRSLIQPAARMFTDYDDGPLACRVHDMVLDLICSLSREESFVASILVDTMQNTPSWGRKVRRLSLHNTTWPTVVDMSKLRSLTIFNNAIISSMPSLSCYHLLRVLDLENCNLEGHRTLSFVGNLFHLRYLGLQNTRYGGELPVEIGNLQLLQTLHLFGAGIKELPSSIVWLKQLMCLILRNMCLPNGLRNLTSLEELQYGTVDSVDVAEDIGHLTQMRILHVELEINKEDIDICKALVASLGKLQKIQQLTICSYPVPMNLEGSVESLGKLSYLVIDKTASFPTWISPGSLPVLSSLDITVARLRREDIQVLGTLQALHFLEVTVSGDVQAAERFTVGSDSFPCARVCRFYGFHVVPSMFLAGAMPRVENFGFSMRQEDFGKGEFTTDDLALGHLPSLQSVSARLYNRKDAKEVEIKVIETLNHESDVHPNHPSIQVDRYGRRKTDIS